MTAPGQGDVLCRGVCPTCAVHRLQVICSALQPPPGNSRTGGGSLLCQHFESIHPLHTVKTRPTGRHEPQRRPVFLRQRCAVETACQ
jgi:hypothetical protein